MSETVVPQAAAAPAAAPAATAAAPAAAAPASTELSTVKKVDPADSQLTLSGLSGDQSRAVQSAINANVHEWELSYSRLAILQPQSPEITRRMAGYEPGMVVDNVTREIYTTYGKAPWLVGKIPEEKIPMVHFMLFLPIFKLPSEYIKWIPKAEQKEGQDPWEFKTLDERDPRVRDGVWAPLGTFKGKKPPVTTNINFLSMILDHENKMAKSSYLVGTFSRTSYNAGKDLVTYCNRHNLMGIDYWGRAYWAYMHERNEKVSGVDSTWFEFKIAPGPLMRDFNPDIMKFAGQLALQLADPAHPAEGRKRQEAMINKAVLGEDSHGEGGTAEEKKESDPFGDSEGGEQGSQF